VDESLKYHEVQKSELEDLQKTIDELRAGNQALLAELSGWRGCLDATPVQAAPAQILEANALQNDAVQFGSHDHMPMYDAIVIPAPITTHEAPQMVPVNYSTQAGAIANPVPDGQFLDNYTFQGSAAMLANDNSFNDLPRISQHHLTQAGTRDRSYQHALWSAPQSSHIPQALWTQPPYQELPPIQRRQYPGQGYDLNSG